MTHRFGYWKATEIQDRHCGPVGSSHSDPGSGNAGATRRYLPRQIAGGQRTESFAQLGRADGPRIWLNWKAAKRNQTAEGDAAQDTPSPLGNVILIDDNPIKSSGGDVEHFARWGGGSPLQCAAIRAQRGASLMRAGHYERNLHARAGEVR
jgi:hypothetical protein